MIKTTKRHYVVFYSPGTFFAESSKKEINSWDPHIAAKLAEDIKERYGAKPYGFKFETYLESEPVVDESGNQFKVEPKKIEESEGIYYLGGKVETYDEVIGRATKEDTILISNMKCNRYWTIITNNNSYKSTQSFGLKDVVIDHNGLVIINGRSYKDYHAKMDKLKDSGELK